MIRSSSVFVFFALIGAAFGQVTPGQLRGPVMGYIPDGSSLRALRGIPAAGSVGGALSVGRDLALFEISPSQTVALGTASDTGELLLLTPDDEGALVRAVAVSGSAPGASRIVFSPSGTAAALWFASTGHIQVLESVSSTPVVRDIDASYLGGYPAAFAVSDDSQWIAVAWTSKVYAFGPNSQVNALPVDGAAQALSFFHNKPNIAVFTPTEVVTIADIGGSATPTVLWSQSAEAAAAGNPVAAGLAVSFDNSRLTVAGSTGALFTFNLATGAGIAADCGCTPTGLAGLGGSLFRLNGANAEAVKVFDAATNEVWFVPLATSPAVGGQQ